MEDIFDLIKKLDRVASAMKLERAVCNPELIAQCVNVLKENADVISGIRNGSLVVIPRSPPYPMEYIVTGVRTVNGVSTTVYLEWTNEAGGWYQWTNSRPRAKRFLSEKEGLSCAKHCPGPWMYQPDLKTVTTICVNSKDAEKYISMIAKTQNLTSTDKQNEQS